MPSTFTVGRAVRAATGLVIFTALPAIAQTPAPKANWSLAEKFSAASLKPRVYTSAVNPRWLGQSDSLCYNWKDHSGSTFYLVVPTSKSKKPVFDQTKLASQLSDLSHRAHDPQNLPFTSIVFSKDRKNFTFVSDSSRWQWDVASETLTRLGPARAPGAAGRGGRACRPAGRDSRPSARRWSGR